MRRNAASIRKGWAKDSLRAAFTFDSGIKSRDHQSISWPYVGRCLQLYDPMLSVYTREPLIYSMMVETETFAPQGGLSCCAIHLPVHSARRFAQGIPKALAALAGQALASPFQADQRSGWTAKACPLSLWIGGLHPMARSPRCAARPYFGNESATACDLRDAP